MMLMNQRIDIARKGLLAILPAFAFAFAQPTVAHAQYDSRKSEAKEALDKKQLEDGERDKLENALVQYFDERKRCLDDLVAILDEDDVKPQVDRWEARSEKCRSQGGKLIGESLKDIDTPSVGALAFVGAFAIEEDEFFEGLEGLELAAKRDKIVLIGSRLAEWTKLLDQKWRTLDKNDDYVDDRTREQLKKLDREIDRMVDEATRKNLDVKLAIAKAAEEAAKIPTPTTPSETLNGLIAMAKVGIQHLAQRYQTTATVTEESKQKVRALIISQLTIIVLFEQVREETAKFLKDNDLSQAQAAFAAAHRSINGLVGKGTDGQKSDASRFRDKALGALTKHVGKTRDLYQTFDKNDGKFVGPIDAQTREAILDSREADNWLRTYAGHGLETKLEKWLDEAQKDLMGEKTPRLGSGKKSLLTRKLKSHLDKLQKSIEDVQRRQKEFLEQYEAERKRLADRLE